VNDLEVDTTKCKGTAIRAKRGLPTTCGDIARRRVLYVICFQRLIKMGRTRNLLEIALYPL